MSEPTAFLCCTAAVAALAPKSHGPLLTAWALKYADDQLRCDMLDTFGRLLYFWLFVIVAEFLNWVIA
jgi:hypothetical protein